MSTIKVDTIATRTGSGTITVSNNASLSGTLAVTGTTTTAAITSTGRHDVNFNGSSTQAFKYTDTGGGNLASFGQFYNPSNSLIGNIQNAANAGVHINVGSGSVCFTQTGYTAANALDDYEEGTWTANLIGSTSNPSTAATSAAASYTKIGRMVYARWMIGPVNVAGASGGIRVNGLPFNNAGGHVSGNVMLYYRKAANTDAINLTPYVSGNQVYFYQTRDGYADVWAEILFDLTGASTNFYMYASVVYETSS